MNKKKIVVRADNALFIGIGHTQRCLYIADELRKKGYEVIFICRDLIGSNYQLIQEYGFEVKLLTKTSLSSRSLKDHTKWLSVSNKQDAKETLNVMKEVDCKNIIIDHYGIDIYWENFFRDKGFNIFVLDDIDRKHSANLLIDYSFWKKNSDFFNKVDRECDLAIGIDYFPLDFRLNSFNKRTKDYIYPNILVSVGGRDREGLTMKVIKAISTIKDLSYEKIHIVINKELSNSISKEIKKNKLRYALYPSPNGLGEIYEKSDICIGSSGVSALERCFFGIPSLLVIKALNQRILGKKLEEYGLAKIVKAEDSQLLANKISSFLKMRNNFQEMEEKSQGFIGNQGCKRIAVKIDKIIK